MSDDIIDTPIIYEEEDLSLTLEEINDKCIVIWFDPDGILINNSTNKCDNENIDDHSDPIYNNIDQCIDFLTDLEYENAFLILFGENINETLINCINDISQLNSIYIFTEKNSLLNNKFKIINLKKVKGIFNEFSSIYNKLDKDIQECELNSTPISIISSSNKINFEELDQTFIYSQILKDILIEIKYDNQSKDEFIDYLRILYMNNKNQLNEIEEFQQNYSFHSPIWWYTKEYFIYSMIHRILKTQDLQSIIKIGFFMQQLHQQIQNIHMKTYQSIEKSNIIMYRGERMLNDDFENLKNNAGGLISFDSFLLTTKNKQTALSIVEQSINNPHVTGVLFQMNIDPSIYSSPFATLNHISYFQDSKDEYLFSMHTVFQINELYEINDRLWQINLTLTSNDYDERLKTLNDFIQINAQNPKGWLRLGKFAVKMGELDKAEYIYNLLLKLKFNDPWSYAHIHRYLGIIYQQKQDLSQALIHFQQSLSIKLKYLHSNHYALSSTYNSIALVLEKQGHFDKALEYFQRSLYIELNSSQSNQLTIATQYTNIGFIFQNQEKYDKALENYQRSLNIRIIYLPSQHPDLAMNYASIAITYYSMGDFLPSLTNARKALKIAEKSLESDHPLISQYHYIIAISLDKVGHYDEAIIHARFAVQIARQIYEPNDFQLLKYEETLKSLRKKI